jgi:GNAT superfamily N-acetyltransferase
VLRFLPQPLSSPEAQALEALHLAEMSVRYEVPDGEEGDPPEDPAWFEPDAGGCFLVAWLETDGGDTSPVACGGVKRLASVGPDIAELKRMYVVEEARGRGIARDLLERLEDEARSLGYAALWLETGLPQFEAIALYESAGFEPVVPYGRYKDYPDVRCFAKPL